MNFTDLIAAVRQEGGFDTSSSGSTETEVKRWLNQAYREMVAYARWRQAEKTLATTVVDQGEYALDDEVVEVIDLDVGGGEWIRVGPKDLRRLKRGSSRLPNGITGAYAPDYSDQAAKRFELHPAPTTAGLAVTALVALYPTALSQPADTPIVPDEYHEHVVNGAIGVGMRRTEEDHQTAQPFTDLFNGAKEELRRQLTTRVGSGPIQVKVHRYHFG